MSSTAGFNPTSSDRSTAAGAPMPSSLESRRGFTLIEILACVLLFNLGLMAVVGVFLYGLKSATAAQVEATAWATALSVLKDPMPQGASTNQATGQLTPWTWSSAGSTWTASDGSALPVWEYTSWDISSGDITVADMADPKSNSATFSTGSPARGCARGWINGYYVERREQSLSTDRLSTTMRLVEVRVDVYLASFGPTNGRPLASAVDRVVRNGGL